MQNTTLGHAQIDQPDLNDPFSYVLASWDADMMELVHDALKMGRMELALHPVVAADNHSLKAFYEGLVRLSDRNGRVLPTAQFMPMIEQTALGRELDCATLKIALGLLDRKNDLRLSINLSARSIGDTKWRRILDAGLCADPGLGERLIFEISETSAMLLHENVSRFMTEMQPLGVGFALDGFGAGLTAFRHLKTFFFDLVKIDKSFIRGIDQNPDNQVLAEALITVAHQFDMFAVADGIETEAEADYLKALGADCLQGYYFGMPSPPI